jgi:Ca2+-binding RTX toxin-like protein
MATKKCTASAWLEVALRPAAAEAYQRAASKHLEKKGLALNIDAGRAPYDYALQIGTGGADALAGAGAGARDYLWGRAGADTLSGGNEMDNLFGDAGNDLLVGGAGGDRLLGGAGNDLLYGGTASDGLMGGMGNDILDEGAGHGDLNGGMGCDILIGGLGADAFMISADSGHDVIRDFTAGPGMFDHLAINGLHWRDLSFTDTARGVKISWGGGSVLLAGVVKADLAQDDFMFAEAPELPPSSRPAGTPRAEVAAPSQAGPAVPGSAAPMP